MLQNYDLINIWSHVTSSKHKEVLDIVRLREREGHRVDSGGHSKVIKDWMLIIKKVKMML